MPDEKFGICAYTDAPNGAECAILKHHLVEQCVETLCHKGCRAVWADIDALEAGVALPETRGLSSAEVREVVSELKAIMSVYRGTCAAG